MNEILGGSKLKKPEKTRKNAIFMSFLITLTQISLIIKGYQLQKLLKVATQNLRSFKMHIGWQICLVTVSQNSSSSRNFTYT